MKLYYVEQKAYYRNTQGDDIQFADGGHTPILYHSAEKAISCAKRIIGVTTDCSGYEVTIDNDNYPCKGTDVIYATRLEDRQRETRCEIRIYEIETRN